MPRRSWSPTIHSSAEEDFCKSASRRRSSAITVGQTNLVGGTGHYLNSEIELGRGVLDVIRTHRDRVGSPRFASRHQSQRHRLALQAEPEMVASAWPGHE